MPNSPSYRNPSIDLKSKSIDWFQYDGNFGVEWVKKEERKQLFHFGHSQFNLWSVKSGLKKKL